MKLTINKKISSVFFLLVFSILLFGLANNVFAVNEIETLQYFLPFEDQEGSGGGAGGTTIDDGDTTTPPVTRGGTAQSVTFHYVYKGVSSLYPGYRPIDCYSVEPSGLRCDIDLGFKSDITPAISCDNVWGNKRMDIDIGSPTGDVYVYWEADECDYNMPYEITGSGGVAIVGGSSTITSSGDLYCKGGTLTTTNCGPSDGWETGSCPAPYFCPGYGQGVSGNSTFNEGSTQTVTFSKAVTKDPQVEITANYSTQDITINKGESAVIRWSSSDVDECKLTTVEKGGMPIDRAVININTDGITFYPSIDTTYTISCE